VSETSKYAGKCHHEEVDGFCIADNPYDDRTLWRHGYCTDCLIEMGYVQVNHAWTFEEMEIEV
jgi:hypothetical protein